MSNDTDTDTARLLAIEELGAAQLDGEYVYEAPEIGGFALVSESALIEAGRRLDEGAFDYSIWCSDTVAEHIVEPGSKAWVAACDALEIWPP